MRLLECMLMQLSPEHDQTVLGGGGEGATRVGEGGVPDLVVVPLQHQMGRPRDLVARECKVEQEGVAGRGVGGTLDALGRLP